LAASKVAADFPRGYPDGVYVGKHIRRLSVLGLGLVVASCASGDSTVAVDAFWNLTCPEDDAVDCASLAEDTCLGDVGQRSIVGARGERACDDLPISVSCQAIDRPNGERTIFLEASAGSDFAFELRGATVNSADGTVEATGCTVTIVEDGLPYDLGDCGSEPPSMAQPCQLSNVVSENGEVSFDLECRSLMSSAPGTIVGFDVVDLGGGPTTISFTNCEGF
jgi:hypothetical protein